MSYRLKKAYQVARLASDLGLQGGEDPVSHIVRFCERKIRKVASEFNCWTLPKLLEAVATVLGTTFVEIHSDKDLVDVKGRYLQRGEKAFVTLETDLSPSVFAITFKLSNRKKWQPKYVSVIDCRGDKRYRAYFSKWHELAHLLTLTDQMRLVFTRTHVQEEGRDPEEALMEVIAGTFGFWEDVVGPDARGEISFDAIEKLRVIHTPEASSQSSLIGFVRAWKSPCVLIEVGPGVKKSQKHLLRSDTFDFVRRPKPELRALKVTPNGPARDAGVVIYQNIRVPSTSVIHRVFFEGPPEAEAVENLGSWTTSSGGSLTERPVHVMARRRLGKVDALIVPTD